VYQLHLALHLFHYTSFTKKQKRVSRWVLHSLQLGRLAVTSDSRYNIYLLNDHRVLGGNELLSVIRLLSRICLCHQGKFKHEANVITALLASGTEINDSKVKYACWTWFQKSKNERPVEFSIACDLVVLQLQAVASSIYTCWTILLYSTFTLWFDVLHLGAGITPTPLSASPRWFSSASGNPRPHQRPAAWVSECHALTCVLSFKERNSTGIPFRTSSLIFFGEW